MLLSILTVTFVFWYYSTGKLLINSKGESNVKLHILVISTKESIKLKDSIPIVRFELKKNQNHPSVENCYNTV